MFQVKDRKDISAMVRAGIRNIYVLIEASGRSRATVYRVISKVNQGDSLEHAKGAGPPRKLGKREKRIIRSLFPMSSTHRLLSYRGF